MQFDEESRGFSLKEEGPLDMRMDPTTPYTAEQFVNEASEEELGKVFREYGEEKLWRKGAKAIVRARHRRIRTTKELSEIIETVIPRGKKQKIHPATRIFQAIRIYVNKELSSVEQSIAKAMKHLAPKGRIAALSFHSLEDRIVKNVFREASQPLKNVRGEVVKKAMMQVLTKKPLIPSRAECRKNRRARSAKLRAAAMRG